LQGLLDILAPDVVLLGDGGGIKQAVLRPIVGADKVARLVISGFSKVAPDPSFDLAEVNGLPAMVIRLAGELDTVVAVSVVDAKITGLYAVRNPEKLSHMQQRTPLRRSASG
jgi:hypothetical protein